MPLIWRLFLLCSMTGMHWQPADDYLDDPKLWKDVKGLTESGLSINARCHPRFAHSLQLVIMDGLSCLSIAKVTLGKVSKLANLVHQSPLFRSATEDAFGSSRSVPETNSTWWNSVWQQLQAVVQLELQNLIFAKVKKNNDCTPCLISLEQMLQDKEDDTVDHWFANFAQVSFVIAVFIIM